MNEERRITVAAADREERATQPDPLNEWLERVRANQSAPGAPRTRSDVPVTPIKIVQEQAEPQDTTFRSIKIVRGDA
jgi:hypothetical protein